MSTAMELGWKLCVLLLATTHFLFQGSSSSSSSEFELRVERKLKLLNKLAVKSIQSEDGDIIDCVPLHKQPAFDHPLLINHTIQMKPSRNSFPVDEGADSPDEAKPLLLSTQVWLKSGNCPEGTIPIRRVQKHHLLNAPSIENYGKKNTTEIQKYEINLSNTTLALGVEALHSMSVLLTAGYSYIGAKAYINVWNPYVEANDEYSSGHVSLRNGEYNNSAAIDFGWIVNPAVYGDKRTRLFIYWTDDSGRSTGCFDLLCSGFVQISKEIAFGSVIDPVSQSHGDQYHIDLFAFMDFNSGGDGNWWLVYRNTTLIGYWPSALFTRMYVSALVLFGGDVYSPRMTQKPHTATAMGSGKYASEHWSYAAFIAKPRIEDYSHVLKYPDPSQASSLRPNCYSAENFAAKLFTEPLFYYGGPGRNAYCP